MVPKGRTNHNARVAPDPFMRGGSVTGVSGCPRRLDQLYLSFPLAPFFAQLGCVLVCELLSMALVSPSGSRGSSGERSCGRRQQRRERNLCRYAVQRGHEHVRLLDGYHAPNHQGFPSSWSRIGAQFKAIAWNAYYDRHPPFPRAWSTRVTRCDMCPPRCASPTHLEEHC